jgi:hypothetical protein
MCYRGPDGHCLGLFCIYNIFFTIKKNIYRSESNHTKINTENTKGHLIHTIKKTTPMQYLSTEIQHLDTQGDITKH